MRDNVLPWRKGKPLLRANEMHPDSQQYDKDLVAGFLLDKDRIYLLALGFDFHEDVFSNTFFFASNSISRDGDYTWTDALAYYVHTYSIELPQCFVEYIQNIDRQSSVKPFTGTFMQYATDDISDLPLISEEEIFSSMKRTSTSPPANAN